MKLAEAPQTYEALRDFFVKEQFLDSSPADLSTYLRERRLVDFEEVARSAELFLGARKRQLSDERGKVLLMGKTNLSFSRRKNSNVTFVESPVTLPRIVRIKRLKVD